MRKQVLVRFGYSPLVIGSLAQASKLIALLGEMQPVDRVHGVHDIANGEVVIHTTAEISLITNVQVVDQAKADKMKAELKKSRAKDALAAATELLMKETPGAAGKSDVRL